MVEIIKTAYLEAMAKHYVENKCSGPWTRQWMQDIIEMMNKNVEVTNTKWSIYDRNLKEMYVNQFDGEKFVLMRILKSNNNTVNLVPVIPWEDSFDIIWKAHLESQHGNITETMKLIKSNYFINLLFVGILINLCKCQKDTVVSDLVHYNIEGSLQILDMTSSPDKEFNYVLIYNDTRTNLIQLRPLAVVNVLEISLELVQMFTDLGPPRTVVVYEPYFYDNVFENVNKVFNPCRIDLKLDVILNESRKVNKLYQVSTMLDVWMKMNRSINWALGCYFVQLKMNVTLSDNKIPHHIVFGNNMFGNSNCRGRKVAKNTSQTVSQSNCNMETDTGCTNTTETNNDDEMNEGDTETSTVNLDNEDTTEIDPNKKTLTESKPEIAHDEIEIDVSYNKHDKMIESTFICWRCENEVSCNGKIQDSTEIICQSCIKEEENIT